MNVDRFWLGFITGLLVAALIVEVCKWAETHVILLR